MNERMLTQKDLAEMERFRKGFPWMDIVSAATPGNGITVLTPDEVGSAVARTDLALSGKDAQKLDFAKFIPASGAASRMFKDLFARKAEVVDKFSSQIDRFAFYDASIYDSLDAEGKVEYTLGEKGLGYGSKPKAVLAFHRYPDEVRTALAEHLVEAAAYIAGPDGKAPITVTISPEHQELFNAAIAAVKSSYEKKYGVEYDIRTVFQQKWTDTLAVTPDNEPFLLEDGTPLHRPGGHGALIHNLSEVDADIVSIKNIDNVAVERMLPVTVKWKKVLLGTALLYREKIFSLVKSLRSAPTPEAVGEAESFLRDKLFITLPESSPRDAATLLSYLDRPIRVCGMVKNEGEPGGGPFIIREKDGSTSLQILEGAQINPNDPHAVSCQKGATHFNPVDLVCVLRDSEGKAFKLEKYVDEEAGFISSKSLQGRELKALELPGLWNGAMSRWNTVFVEVPIETFNPVKTVMDLLRPAHQG